MVSGHHPSLLALRRFQLDHHKRKPVEKQHHIGAPFGCAHHGKLVHGKPVVLRIRPIHQAQAVVNGFVLTAVFDGHTVHQQAVNPVVLSEQIRELQIAHGMNRVFDGLRGRQRVEPFHRLPQAWKQEDFLVIAPCRICQWRRLLYPGTRSAATVWIKKGACVQRITFRLQQRENVFFKIGFACPGHGGT